jgi:hypothetical protein
MVTKIVKWVSLPALLIASIFSRSAANYELLVDVMICVGTIVFMQRAVRLREYFGAAGLALIAVIVSPLPLVVKIFLLIGLTCIASIMAMLVAFRPPAAGGLSDNVICGGRSPCPETAGAIFSFSNHPPEHFNGKAQKVRPRFSARLPDDR